MKPLRLLMPVFAAGLSLLLLTSADSGVAFHAPMHDLGLAPADVTVYGADGLDRLGTAVAGGDFNGDGIEDLLVGADEAGAGVGRAYVIFGSSSLSGTKDLSTSEADLQVIGAGSDRLGAALAAGDFNADGIDDLLIGAFDSDGPADARLTAGEAYVIFGSPSLGGTKNVSTSDEDLTVFGADAGDELGIAVAAGDINGDGIDDVLVGGRGADGTGEAKPQSGEAYVFFGSATLGGTKDLASSPADLTLLGVDAGDEFGESVAAADLNGDGFEDVLSGAYLADGILNGKADAGEAFAVFGSPTIGGRIELAASAFNGVTVVGADAGDQLAVRISAGDVNGDGFADLITGAYLANASGNPVSGEAYVIYGSPSLGGTKDLGSSQQDVIILGAEADDRLGLVAETGDLNGDGVDDLLVPADLADGAGNGKPNAGEGYVIYGSSALASTWDIGDDAQDFTVIGADADDQAAGAMAAVDLNGDGIDDLVVGASEADGVGNATNKAGEAHVIFGRCAAGTADFDLDGLCNPFDPDDDNDRMADGSDPCPTSFEDFDGFEDDGCADPDNDGDGVCDSGQTSVSCSGSDSGQMCFDPAGTLSCAVHDCRSIAEDYDAFKDNDGCPEPDNDNDGFPDVTDDCPGTDSLAGADGMLGSPEDLNHNGIKDSTESPLSTDDVVLTFEDYDTVLNGDGCHDSPGQDFDGDGYTDDMEEGSVLCNGVNNDAFDDNVIDDGCPGGPSQAGSFSEAQFRIGTKAFDPCGQDAWPSDLVSTGFSANKFDIVDLGSFVAPLRRMDKNPGEAGFDSRWDLAPGNSGFGKFINIADLGATITGARGFPPMLGGQKALNKICPLAP